MANTIRVVQSLAGAPFGGAESFYTRLVCALAQNPALQQTALTRANPQRISQLEAAGVSVQTFRFGSPLDLLDRHSYRKTLRALDPDVVLTYMSRASDITPAGNYRMVCRLGHFYNLKYYRHADYWIGNTLGICDYLVKGGMPAERVVHISNFADEAPAAPLPRDSFGTPPDRPLLLAAGRLHTNKAFDTLLRALAGVPEATLWLAGDGPERNNLETLSTELHISDRVRFLGWRNDVASLMQTADLFICPSRHEGLGGIVLESWLHGCPVIATDSQGPSELIQDGHTGLLTPVDEYAPLADTINQLLQNPRQATCLADNARVEYSKHHSTASISRQYAELFAGIAG